MFVRQRDCLLRAGALAAALAFSGCGGGQAGDSGGSVTAGTQEMTGKQCADGQAMPRSVVTALGELGRAVGVEAVAVEKTGTAVITVSGEIDPVHPEMLADGVLSVVAAATRDTGGPRVTAARFVRGSDCQEVGGADGQIGWPAFLPHVPKDDRRTSEAHVRKEVDGSGVTPTSVRLFDTAYGSYAVIEVRELDVGISSFTMPRSELPVGWFLRSQNSESMDDNSSVAGLSPDP
jgi:hypothetical protein